ncbi:MAG: hypothetical protein AB8C95_02875 [Phycisphaeraceae bacterium]
MSQPTSGTEKLVLCPYCGHAQYGGDRCQACAGLFEPLSRRATQLAMGPWQIRDKNQPFRPSCCYDVLKSMAAAGKIKPTTVLRGPTTRQFWSIARNVPGVSHLIGYCHECGNHVSPSDARCGECKSIFTEPRERNELGLIFKNDIEAEIGTKQLKAEINGEPMPTRDVPGQTKKTKPKAARSNDLLSEVLDLSGDVEPAALGLSAPPPKAPGIATATVGQPATANYGAPPPAQRAAPPTSAFDVEPTSELPSSEGISTIGLLMIGLNIIAIASILVLWLMLGD